MSQEEAGIYEDSYSRQAPAHAAINSPAPAPWASLSGDLPHGVCASSAVPACPRGGGGLLAVRRPGRLCTVPPQVLGALVGGVAITDEFLMST